MNRRCFLVMTLVLLASVIYCKPAAALETTTVSALMEELKEQNKNAVYNVKLNAPFDKESTGVRENVSTETGEVSVANQIFTIPGRGIDLSLCLEYRSRDAKTYDESTKSGDLANNFGQTIIALYDVFDANGYWLRTGALRYTTDYSTIIGQTTIGTETWIFTGYLQYENGSSLLTGANIINTTRQKSLTAEAMHIFGEGWSLNLPWLDIDDQKVYVNLPNRKTYPADFSSANGLKDYELADLLFTKDTTSGNGKEPSAYKLYYVTGDSYYFSAKGELLLQSDRFNNNIRYYWEDVNGKRLLTKIVDTVDRAVEISYNDTSTTFRTGDQMVRFIKTTIPGQPTRYYLSSFIDPIGREFRYKYTFTEAAFDSVGKTPVNNCYANLIEILYPSGAQTKYVFDKSKKSLSSNGYMEYFKTVERKDQDGKQVYNRLRYQYYNEPDGYPKFNASSIDENYTYYSNIMDSNGVTTRYVFNSKHLPYITEQKTDHLIYRIFTTYHTKNNLPIQYDTKKYNSRGKYIEMVDFYEYDDRGNLIIENHPESPKLVNTDAHKTFYTYDYYYNLLTGKKYKQNQDTIVEVKNTLSSNKKTLHLSETRSNGDLLDMRRFTYDDYGNLTETNVQKDAEEWTATRFEYSREYKGAYQTAVINEDVKDADGDGRDLKTSFTYDFNNGCRLSFTDGNGNTTNYEYDKLNRLLKTILPDGANSSNSYDDKSNILETKDPNGNILTYDYDALGHLQKVLEGSNTTTLVKREYDANGMLITQQDGNKNIQKMTYDKQRRITGVTHYDRNGKKLAETRVGYNEAFYDRFGKPFVNISATRKGDGVDQTINYYFDIYGRLAKQGRLHAGQEELAYFWYDYLGYTTQVMDFAGRKNSFAYDSLGRMLEASDAEGGTTSNTYDLMGNRTSCTDALGQTAYLEYDSLGRNTLVKTPYDDGQYSISKCYYDRAGNIEKVVDPQEYVTKYHYSNRNFLSAVEKMIKTGEANITKYEYDRNGNMLQVIKGLNSWNDPDFSTNTFEYDSFNRLIRSVDALHRATTNEYDRNGNLVNTVDRNGVSIGVAYDGLNRPVKIQNSKDGKKTLVTKTYDLLGNLKEVTDASGATQYEYDDLGRLIYLNYGNGFRKNYTYDSADMLTELQIMQGGLNQIDLKYEYDRVGRMTAVNDNGKWFKYQYDQTGLLTNESNGVTGIKSEYTYYPSGNLKSLRHFNAGEIVANYEYKYDLRGNQVQKDEGPNTSRYYYDALSRLKAAELPGDLTQNYEYDDLNNIREIAQIKGGQIEQTNFTYDRNSRLMLSETACGQTSRQLRFDYDEEGNQVYKEEVNKENGDLISSSATNFWYNGFNQLQRVQDPNGQYIDYTYNAQGLRTKKDFTDRAVNYIYDRGSIVLESDKDLKVTAKNIRGLRLIYRESNEENLYYLHNAHGDVTKLLNEKGWVVKDYDYDPYGREEAAPVKAYGGDVSTELWRNETQKIDNPFRYSGEYLDEETENYYLRARYYDPETRRFTSEDSLKGIQELNYYAYCSNNPVNRVDPSGHFDVPPDPGENPSSSSGTSSGSSSSSKGSSSQKYLTGGQVCYNISTDPNVWIPSDPQPIGAPFYWPNGSVTYYIAPDPGEISYSAPTTKAGWSRYDIVKSMNNDIAVNQKAEISRFTALEKAFTSECIRIEAAKAAAAARRAQATQTRMSAECNSDVVNLILSYTPEPSRPLSDYYGTFSLPPKKSNGYLTINIKTPSSLVRTLPLLGKVPAGGGFIIDLDDGHLGTTMTLGPDFMYGVTWTGGEPKTGTDYIAEQYVVVGVTASRNGDNSIGIGWGGGFGKQWTRMW